MVTTSVRASLPKISILPELGVSTPKMICNVVDLPAPLGPIKPKFLLVVILNLYRLML